MVGTGSTYNLNNYGNNAYVSPLLGRTTSRSTPPFSTALSQYNPMNTTQQSTFGGLPVTADDVDANYDDVVSLEEFADNAQDLGLYMGGSQKHQLGVLSYANRRIGGFDGETSYAELDDFVNYKNARMSGYRPRSGLASYTQYAPNTTSSTLTPSSTTTQGFSEFSQAQTQYLPSGFDGFGAHYIPTNQSFGTIPNYAFYPNSASTAQSDGYTDGFDGLNARSQARSVNRFVRQADLNSDREVSNIEAQAFVDRTQSYGTHAGQLDTNQDGFLDLREIVAGADDLNVVDTLFNTVSHPSNRYHPRVGLVGGMGNGDDGYRSDRTPPAITLDDIDTDGNGKIDLYDLTRNKDVLGIDLKGESFAEDAHTLYDYLYTVGGEDGYINAHEMSQELDYINDVSAPTYDGYGYTPDNGYNYTNTNNAYNTFGLSSLYNGQPTVYHMYK